MLKVTAKIRNPIAALSSSHVHVSCVHVNVARVCVFVDTVRTACFQFLARLEFCFTADSIERSESKMFHFENFTNANSTHSICKYTRISIFFVISWLHMPMISRTRRAVLRQALSLITSCVHVSMSKPSNSASHLHECVLCAPMGFTIEMTECDTCNDAIFCEWTQ